MEAKMLEEKKSKSRIRIYVEKYFKIGLVLVAGIAVGVIFAPSFSEGQPMQAVGNFGYAGEEDEGGSDGIPTTVVLVRNGFRRVLMVSSGKFGQYVTQGARWSTVTESGLEVIDANGDAYDDVIADGLILYGSHVESAFGSGLSVWEPTSN